MSTRRTAGFTLVEVVIALTLMSLIMLGLVSALSTFGETGGRIEERGERADDMRLVSGFLRQILSTASIQHRHARDDGTMASYFIGSAGSLEWLGRLPARHGAGGLHHVRLSTREEGDMFDLVLKLRPYAPPPTDELGTLAALDWGQEPERILVRQITGFSIAYQRLGGADWQDEWVDPDVLPGRVALRVFVAGNAWPELIIPVLEAEPGSELNEQARN